MSTAENPSVEQDLEEDEYKQARELSSIWKWISNTAAVIIAGFYIYGAGFGAYSPQYHRGIYLLLTSIMVFLIFPFSKKSPLNRPSVPDTLLALLSLLAMGYWIVEYVPLAYRPGAYTDLDIWMSYIGTLLTLEVARRALGLAIPLVALFSILFAYFGPYFPEIIAHRGFTLRRIVEFVYLSNEGVFGVLADAFATYVLIFIFFGAFMRKSGAGQFFLDLPISLFGSSTGGPAKAAIIGSAVFGTVSGSAIANVVGTGTFTIPLMKKAGYRSTVAGAVETASSTGGQIMPPVMSAAAFVIAELTSTSYWYIVTISVVPALLYFMSVFIMVHLEAKKHNIRGFNKEDLPNFREVLKNGWRHLIPLVVLVIFMARLYSPFYAAFWSIISIVVTSWFHKTEKMKFKEIWEACIEGARACIVVGSSVGAIGVVIGIVTLTGIGLKFSNIIIYLSGNSLIIAWLLVCFAAFVLGMGLPTTPAYIILAVLAVPALNELGVPVLSAHLIVLWLVLNSGFTPPVCVAAYAAAAIAKADPWKTGWYAFNFAKVVFLMPLLFAFTDILLSGSAVSNLWAVISATVGTVAFSICSMFYFVRKTTIFEWSLLAVGSVLCLIPGWVTDVAGVLLVVLVYIIQKRSETKQVTILPIFPKGAS